MRNIKFLERISDNFYRLFGNFHEAPLDVLKEEVLRTEEQIRNVVGPDADYVRIPDTDDQKEELELLLDQRRTLLNWMFMETPQEVARMKQLNTRLFDLTNRLRVKMADVCESLASHQRDDFDDDLEVEGTLSFSYNGEDSILPYDGANVYGSDYRLMIATNNYLTGDEYSHYLELGCRYDWGRDEIIKTGDMDDGISWLHYTTGMFEGICICYTTSLFCRYAGYPFQDVLQLNDFWNEVHVRYQHFATQDKNYKYPRK